MNKKIPLPSAIAWIMASNIIVCAGAYHLLKAYQGYHYKKYVSSYFDITSIIQSCSQRDVLSPMMLSQMLELSSDKPSNIFRFNPRHAEEKLLSYPMIQTAKVKTIKPSRIYVEYTLRNPIASVSDYENIAVDDEGFLLPYFPFYSPKALPEIYLGEKMFREEASYFGKVIDREKWPYVANMLKTFEGLQAEHGIKLKKLDVSKIYHESLGMKEIIVEMTEESNMQTQGFHHYLRLNPATIEKALGNYLVLLEQLREENKLIGKVSEDRQKRVVDLRVNDVAIIQEVL